jgi:hypothetical protein
VLPIPTFNKAGSSLVNVKMPRRTAKMPTIQAQQRAAKKR